MEIKQQLVKDSVKPKFKIGGVYQIVKMRPLFISIHETANYSKGADAQAHANLQEKGNSRSASWHVQVDDKEAIQSIPFDECAMHGGDGLGIGNMKSIAIEICVNADGDYVQAVKNAAEVTHQLMKQFNIPLANVREHHSFSGKNCPRLMRAGHKGITFARFKEMVASHTKAPKPVVVPKRTVSIVDYLLAQGKSATYGSRRKLAREYGIENYTGTAAQNTLLLEKLRGKASPVKKKPSFKLMDTDSIVDFLNANGMDSDFDARKKLATKHGIKGYKGTAAQNTKLLNLIKKG